ncbi:glycosyltransferase [Planktothrix agardhii]|uniref:glycosyltransferase n=1 Tax=Planktothrix agardhii TaxID=1160 RepID=UPI001D0AD3F4|nr:glycosyltransferase [Planktothrix agardhii]MCB8788983.1 glycosyltransferase [Planktothrix agardhii 1025]MCF3578832.1 glycosyltransferase [Planktothrix agardhii 1812]MCF3614292.1 glycosyltransferase [Planktothrix agardhii 1027]MCF3648073.1 glycosyltransferase [Planktothrix agardhii 1026]
MTHFAILAPAAIGHLNPMSVLGRELQRRGHQVTFFGVPDIEVKLRNSGLDFWSIGETEFPLGSLEEFYKKLGQMSGIAGLKFTINWLKISTKMLFNQAPNALKLAGVEAILVDQVTLGGGTIAEFLNLPFITICNALLINREPGVPPYFTGWDYSPSLLAQLRNRVGNFFLVKVGQPIRELVQQQRREWNLSPYKTLEDNFSKLAQICQLPAEYDFPRTNLADCFHYTGPLQDPSGLEPISFTDTEFPFEKLTNKPLIYASLGTLQNRNLEVFETIACACEGLDAQLVISLGNPNYSGADLQLTGSPLVVNYAPHQQLIEKANLIITHAGMNTVLGALASGKPILAIPITNEQPGIAARLARTGAGEALGLKQLTIYKLQELIKRVLTEKSYQQNALKMQEAIRRAGGVSRAADIIEQVITTGKPALR